MDDRFLPVVVNSGTGYSDIAAASYHTFGLTTSGHLKCWGNDDSWQLGIRSTIVRGPPSLVDIGTTYRQVSAGLQHTCGITTSGVLKCWGGNSTYQLGFLWELPADNKPRYFYP